MNWDAFEKVRQSVIGIEQPPEGAFSTRQYMEQYKLKQRTAHEQLTKLVQAGKLKRIKVVSSKGGGGWYTVVESTQEPDHVTTVGKGRGNDRGRTNRR